MNNSKQEIAKLIVGMRDAFKNGENAMAWARANVSPNNTTLGTLISYDLQSGQYVEKVRKNPEYQAKWCEQLASILRRYISGGDRILEAGVGEATTLVGVIKSLSLPNLDFYGFDLSWSRIMIANKWIEENGLKSNLFVGDLFNIPIEDDSIDVVYTSHSLEPNRFREESAIRELMRVARKALVLIEPYYEMASKTAQERMDCHGYVRGLKSAALNLGLQIVEDRLLEVMDHEVNPSGVLVLIKPNHLKMRDSVVKWKDPVSGVSLRDKSDHFFADQVGIGYPVLKGIPCLRSEHAIICSKI